MAEHKEDFIMRSNAANARHKAREQQANAKRYDRARYDGNEGEEVA